MATTGQRVVEEVYAAFVAGDLETLVSLCDQNIEFIVRMPEDGRSYVGEGQGNRLLGTRLGAFLDAFDVLAYRVRLITEDGPSLRYQIYYHYRDKISRLEIDGTMRHEWTVVADKVAALEVIHDSERMSAWFKLVERARETV